MMITPSYRYAVVAVLHGFLSEKNVIPLFPNTHRCGANLCPVPRRPAACVLLVVGNAQSRLCPFVRTNDDGDNNINYSHTAAAAAALAPL